MKIRRMPCARVNVAGGVAAGEIKRHLYRRGSPSPATAAVRAPASSGHALQ